MRSQLQTAGFVIVLVLVVGGVAFIRNWTPTKTATQEVEKTVVGNGAKEDDTRLTIPYPVAEGLPEFELHGHGRHDYWFQNPNAFPVDVGLRSKSCKCSKIEAFVAAADEEKALRDALPRAVAAQAGAADLLPFLSLSAATDAFVCPFYGKPERWLALTPGDDTGVEVPANSSGWVRLNWEGKAKGPLRLGIKVWAQAHGNPLTRGEDTSLEIPINVVDPVRVSPQTVSVSYLYPGRSSTVEAYCWSSTRPGFSLSAAEKNNDPCFDCRCEPLIGSEFRRVHDKLNADPLLFQTNPLAIYRVSVTVSERRPDGVQMDLGPFVREVLLNNDVGDPLVLTVAGTVRGDIDVGAGEDRDRIMLRTFSASRGTSETFPVVCRTPGVRLRVASVSPAFVEAKLSERPNEDGHYDLEVTIPPNRAGGKFADDSAIYLEESAAGQPARRIRVPIVGMATLETR